MVLEIGGIARIDHEQAGAVRGHVDLLGCLSRTPLDPDQTVEGVVLEAQVALADEVAGAIPLQGLAIDRSGAVATGIVRETSLPP